MCIASILGKKNLMCIKPVLLELGVGASPVGVETVAIVLRRKTSGGLSCHGKRESLIRG
jgi:hypothetical protein